MQTTWSEHNWFDDNKSIKRHIIAFTLSAAIIMLLLAVPLPMKLNFVEEQAVLRLELSKAKPTIKPTIKPIPKPQKSIPQPSVDSKEVKPIEIKPKVIVPEIIKAKPIKPVSVTQKPLPSSAEIFNLTYGKVTLDEIDKDFQAPTENAEDFKIKDIKQHKIYQVTKHIDEERDKPSTYMNFYALGIEGSVERFFDKISYKKKFTTRYGTKIYCGGVGPLVICSWK